MFPAGGRRILCSLLRERGYGRLVEMGVIFLKLYVTIGAKKIKYRSRNTKKMSETQQTDANRIHLSEVEKLVDKYQTRLRAFLFSRTHVREDAEDLAQEVFLVAFRNFEQYDPSRPEWPWLVGIARNKLREYWRQKAREPATDPLDEFIISEESARSQRESSTAAESERYRLMEDCLDRLGPEARTLMKRIYDEGLKTGEVADELKRKGGAIRMSLHRIRIWLERCVERAMGSETP